MYIYPTEFECTLDNDELGYIRKGLFLLREEIKKRPGGWKDNGKVALSTIKLILDKTDGLL